MDNVVKDCNKLVITKKRRNYLLSEPDYQTTKIYSASLLAIEMRKKEILRYLVLSILELRKIVTYEFCYDYAYPENCGKAKLW